MKPLTVLLGIIGMLALTSAAHADNRYGRGYDRHYDRGHYGRNYSRHGYYGGFNRHYSPYPYGGYVGFSLGGHHHDHFSGGSFLGGLVLGSVLTHSASRPSHVYRSPVSRSTTVKVIRRTPIVTGSSSSGRRLLKDLSGRCWEIFTEANGDESRTELDPSACEF